MNVQQTKNVDGKPAGKDIANDPRFLTTDVGHNVHGYEGNPEAEQREAVQTEEETRGTRVNLAAKKDQDKNKDLKVTVH